MTQSRREPEHALLPNVRPGRRRRVVAVLMALLSLSSIFAGVATVFAQALPPNRFYGTVTINGALQPEGTVVEAYVGTTLCGAGTIANHNGSDVYLVDVLGSGAKQGCASDGDTVTFRVAGLNAKETGTYQTGVPTRLDLTATGTATQVALPTVLPPGGGGTPAPPPSVAAATPTPATAAAPPPVEASPAPPSATTTVLAATATPPLSIGSATATATETATPVAITTTSTSSGFPSRVWIAIIVVVLVLIGGVGAWIYQRRAAP